MGISEAAAWSGLAISLLSIARIFYFIAVEHATLKVKVDTMWAFTMRRAQSEIVAHGAGEMNSPLRLFPESLTMLEPLKSELRALYDGIKKPISDTDLAILIEKEYGERILHEVCLKYGLYLGACLLLAIAVARNTDTIGDITCKA